MGPEGVEEAKTPGPAPGAGLEARGSGVTPGRGEQRRVVFNSGKLKVVVREGDGYVAVERWHFPIYPYANYVRDEIEIEERGGKWYCLGWTVRDSWGGTGSERWWAEPVEVPAEIAAAVRAVRAPEDFERVAELLRERVREAEEEVDAILQEVIDALVEYARSKRMAEWLRSEEAKRELLEHVQELFDDC